MDLWQRLDATASRWDVLRHPFYTRWSKGELRPEDLSFYAGQYAHAVRALASATRHAAALAPSGAAAAELESHAAEEEAHIELWSRFGDAVGTCADDSPLDETAACSSAWHDPDRGYLPTLVALYAIESAQPAISETKRAGLVEHYGFEPGAGTDYFDLHAVRDTEHAASGRALIQAELDSVEDEDELVAEAERVLEANWRLLDGVEREGGSE
jgi:pyrroloquinoline-quinone synthase